jgi:hypothetical protein
MHATPKSATASTVAIDLAKDVFELAFADADARIVERRRLTRSAFAKAFDNRPSLRIVIETRSSAHYFAAKKQQPLDRTRAWALALSERIGHNKAAVALANKQARRLWAAEHHRTSFDPEHVSVRAAPTN